MLFETKLDSAQIPQIMTAVSKIAPYGLWRKRIESLRDEERKNPFLTDFFDQEYQIERMYDKVRRYHNITGRYPAIDEQNYSLFSFLAALVLLHNGLSDSGRSKLCGNVRGGLRDKAGLAPLAAELRTAGQLMGQGFDVQFADLEGTARFDFLVTKAGRAVELDCKSPSGDVGRQLHAWRFRSFANELTPALQRFVESGGGHLIKVLLPGNLHGDVEYERRLAKQIVDALNNAAPPEAIDLQVSVTAFEISDSPFGARAALLPDVLGDFLLKKFDLENVNAVSRWSPNGGAAVLVIQSERTDRVVEGIHRQLRDSAKNQFSLTRPAALCVQLRDVTATQLRQLGNVPVNGLAAVATRLFSGDARSHLVGVSFVATARELTTSRTVIGDILRTNYQDVGAAYTFANPKNEAASVMGEMFGGTDI